MSTHPSPRRNQRWLAVLLFLASTLSFACLAPALDSPPASRPATLPAPSAKEIESSIRHLASDELEGRGIGLHGLDLAASFIAGKFQTAGLQPPPGQKDFFQALSITTLAGLGEQTSLKSGNTTCKVGTDFNPLSLSAEKAFEGQVVFVGYGITNKQASYDDYEGVDVKGKVALAMRLEPVDAKGKSRFLKDNWSSHAELQNKVRNAAQHGAVALVLVNPPSRPVDTLMPLATIFMGSSSAIPAVHVKRAIAADWLKRGGAKDLKMLETAINEKPSPQSTPLDGISVSGNVAIKRKVNPVKNVVGILPGKGSRADEYIVIGGHYDHLGRGGWGSRSPSSHEIHSGADDNASGSAAVMELARLFSLIGPQDRSLIFVTFTAEEEGLIGSKYFVDHPPVPLEKIVAMLNFDMVGRMKNDQLLIGGTATSSAFGNIAERHTAGLSLNLKNAWKGGYSPSDNTSFLLKRIPALFFFTGLHEDYHRPTDKADKINFAGEASVVTLAERIIVELAAVPKIDFIQPTATMPVARGDTGGAGGGASLGVVPDFGADTTVQGVLISGTIPGSPADKAGLKEGDIIVQLGDSRLTSLYDLSDVLNNAKPGDKMEMTYIRGGKHVKSEVTLAARMRRE